MAKLKNTDIMLPTFNAFQTISLLREYNFTEIEQGRDHYEAYNPKTDQTIKLEHSNGFVQGWTLIKSVIRKTIKTHADFSFITGKQSKVKEFLDLLTIPKTPVDYMEATNHMPNQYANTIKKIALSEPIDTREFRDLVVEMNLNGERYVLDES